MPNFDGCIQIRPSFSKIHHKVLLLELWKNVFSNSCSILSLNPQLSYDHDVYQQNENLYCYVAK